MDAYNPEGVEKRFFSADNGGCWYVQFSKKGENERVAKQLSDVDEHVQKHFHMTLLEDGCSAYFNVRLYPLISEFEYKLRKLIYLASAINHDEKSSSNISDLESQDFGTLFSFLFIDNNFMLRTKDDIKGLNRELFSKANVIATIDAIDENTLWDSLLGKTSVPTLRKRFNDVRVYRNDVMHSHHLSWKKYREINSLYKVINSEINKALHDIEVVESKVPIKPTFNQILNSALRVQETLKPSLEVLEKAIRLYSQILSLSEDTRKLSELYGANLFSPQIQKTQELYSHLSKAYALSPAAFELQGQLQNLAKLKEEIQPVNQKLQELSQSFKEHKIDVPPELIRLQRSLDSFNLNDGLLGLDEKPERIGTEDNEGVK